MAEIRKVVRQISTKDSAGNDVVLDIGSDSTKILVDGGKRTLQEALDNVATNEDIDNLFKDMVIDGGTF